MPLCFSALSVLKKPMTQKPTIAIDGPAAAGKGTLSRHIAAHLNYAHMDTGALYRAVGLKMLETGTSPEDAAQTFAANFTPEDLKNPALRTDNAGQAASKVAAIPAVRTTLLQLQKNFAANPGNAYKGAVLDGRDIGTVIAPDATAKLFITARIDTRAKRRTKELLSRGLSVTYGAVLKDMRERDTRDTKRKSAPLKPAEDAFVLDTSDLTEDQVFEKALQFIQSTL